MFAGIGTLANAAAILAGGTIGLLAKKSINKNLQDSLMHVLGVSTIFVGFCGAITASVGVEGTALKGSGTLLMIISLALGTIVGELLKIEDGLENVGNKLKALTKDGGGTFTEGFTTATLVFAVGAMTIMGSISDGIYHDPSILFLKSIMDGIMSVVFASTLGAGVLFSVIPIAIYQGALTLLASLISAYLSDVMISELSLVGSVMIAMVGINLLFGKKIKVGNVLPALLIPIAWELIKLLIQ